jgi:hypothetical protein
MPNTISLIDVDKFIRQSINALLGYRAIKTAPNFNWEPLFSQNTELDSTLTAEVDPGNYVDLINRLSQPRFSALRTNSKRFLAILSTIVEEAASLFHLQEEHQAYVDTFLATPKTNASTLFGRGALRVEEADAAISALLDIYDATGLGKIDPSIHVACQKAQTTMNKIRKDEASSNLSDLEQALCAAACVI